MGAFLAAVHSAIMLFLSPPVLQTYDLNYEHIAILLGDFFFFDPVDFSLANVRFKINLHYDHVCLQSLLK